MVRESLNEAKQAHFDRALDLAVTAYLMVLSLPNLSYALLKREIWWEILKKISSSSIALRSQDQDAALLGNALL